MDKMDKTIDAINKMNLYVRRAMDDIMPLNWELAPRVIFDFELLYIKEGKAVITIGGKEHTAEKGDFFFFRPMVVHSIRATGNVRLRQPHIHFDFCFDDKSESVYIPVWPMTDPKEDIALARQDISRSIIPLPDKINTPYTDIVEALMFRLFREHNSLNPAAFLRKKALLGEILSYLADFKIESRDTEAPSLSAAWVHSLNTIMDNSYNSKLDIDSLARECGYSKNYLVHLYKEATGKTPFEYHEQIRLEKACTFLAQPEISVTEISSILGFDTIHNFSRFFKRLTGYAPTDYKKKYFNI